MFNARRQGISHFGCILSHFFLNNLKHCFQFLLRRSIASHEISALFTEAELYPITISLIDTICFFFMALMRNLLFIVLFCFSDLWTMQVSPN